MSILIKGMEIPNRCADCPMCYDYMLCRLEGNSFGEIDCIELRADWCPLIELPPHGRLIDADALVKQMHNNIQKTNNARYAWVDELDIALAPTIIESEGENG